MKSISTKQQRDLDTRIKRKFSSYLEDLAEKPRAIINDPEQVMRLKSTLNKNGRNKLAEQVDLATSKVISQKELIEKLKDFAPVDSLEDSSEESISTETKVKVVKTALEAVNGLDDMVSSSFLYEGAIRARTVGRISTYVGPEPIGTGFMISPCLLMTNQHVLENKSEAAECYVEFDYFYSKNNTRIESEIFKIKPELFYMYSKELDYAIVFVERLSDRGTELSNYGWNNLAVSNLEVQNSDRLNIIHHPRGEHQQISIRKNYAIDVEDEDIYIDYVTDTDFGSSGSPVYDDDWNIVALHRANKTIKSGELRREYLQKIEFVSKDLAYEMKAKSITVNSGVRMGVILQDLTERIGQSVRSDQVLLEEIFKHSSMEIDNIKLSNVNESHRENVIPSNDLGQNINIHGGNVTLNVTYGKNDYISTTSRKLANSESDSNMSLELYNKSLRSKKSIFVALDYVQASRELPYLLTETETESIKESYYDSIMTNVNNYSKVELFDALSKRMKETFSLVTRFPQSLDLEDYIQEESSTPSSYHKARAHLYTRIDLHPDGILRGIYTDSVIAPEQLLLVDLINSLDQDSYELPKRYRNSDYLNCEHIVPKTYFDRKEEGFSDLHHLITADGAVNKFRNKDTYADLRQQGNNGRDRIPLYIPTGGWKRDGHFEPARGKSLVARATLYFIVAHPMLISKEVYSVEQINTLKEWSAAELPSDYEIHRNQTIFEVQGNRNPFIDYPEWVEKVDFQKGLR